MSLKLSVVNFNTIAKNVGNAVKSEKALIPAAFIVMGTTGVVSNYKKAPVNEKQNVLKNELVILGGTFVGAITGIVLAGKLPNNFQFFKKVLNDAQKHTNNISRIILEDLCIVGSGIVAGVFSGEIAEKLFPTKKQDKLQQGFNLLSDFDYGLVGDSMKGIAAQGLGGLDKTINATIGLSVAKERGLKNKILRASSEIIGGIIVPVISTYPIVCAAKKYISNPFARLAVTVPTAILSCKVGGRAGEWFQTNITEKLMRKNLLDEIAISRKAIMDYSINNLGSLDAVKKRMILGNLDKLKNIKENFAELKAEFGEIIKDKVEDIGDGIKGVGEKVQDKTEDVGGDFFKFKFLKKLIKKGD